MPVLNAQTCADCHAEFAVRPAEEIIARKVFQPDFPLPRPRRCPECRMRRRLAFRNERKLYRRNCSHSGKPIISVYRPDFAAPVYDQSVWWSEAYDPLAYGREIDFSRPFFEQLAELHEVVPKLAIHNSKSENCEYTNYSAENRNCYLTVGALGSEHCYYSYRVFYCTNIVDSFALTRSELCYECSQGSELYRCCYAVNCRTSSDLYLCEDCVGCSECFGCINLQNQRYHIFNRPFSPADYRIRTAELRRDPVLAHAEFEKLRSVLPRRAVYALNCEDSSGDQIRNCRRCSDVYFIYDSEDVVSARNGEMDRDCAHLNFGDNCELQYDSANLEKNYRVAFASLAWYVSDSFYVLSCFNSRRLFGCCGMKRHENCILNRQYPPDQYEQLTKRLASHMVETEEWGEYFPPSMSPFLFLESIGAELFPLSDERCVELGFNAGELPEVPEEGAAASAKCLVCGRSFRIIEQERRFYSEMELDEPAACSNCRHQARMKRRRPMSLRPAECSRCAAPIYSSAENGAVLCDGCFLDQT